MAEERVGAEAAALHAVRACEAVALGASAGGVQALAELIGLLPKDLPVPVFVVLHLAPSSPSVLPRILSRAGSLEARHPEDGETAEPGVVYVAPTDRHLTVEPGGVLRLTRGPRENGHRPAIDPLFRSAAEAYETRLAAAVLTGTLDDGTAGLVAVGERGGTAIVQNPATALHPSMPLSALTATGTPHVLDIAGIAELLRHLVYDHAGGDLVSSHPSDNPGGESSGETVSIFTCPECGGTLFEQDESATVRFRCRVGHAYAPETLASEQSQALEAALWAAARALLEKADLAERLARRMGDTQRLRSARQFREQATEARRMSEVVQRVIEQLDSTVPEPEEDAVQAAASG